MLSSHSLQFLRSLSRISYPPEFGLMTTPLLHDDHDLRQKFIADSYPRKTICL